MRREGEERGRVRKESEGEKGWRGDCVRREGEELSRSRDVVLIGIISSDYCHTSPSVDNVFALLSLYVHYQ